MAQTESLFFTKLPPEIREEIYRFTFDHDKGTPVKIISLSKWIDRDRMDRRVSYNHIIRPAPICPLYKFLISRDYFAEASATWLRFYSVECHHDFTDMIKASPILKANLTRFTTSWRGTWRWPLKFHVLERCRNLRELRLHVSDDIFDHVANKMCYRDLYTEGDYQAVEQLDTIFAILALERVELVLTEHNLAQTDEEKDIWARNVVALEAFLNRTVKRLREAEKGAGGKAEADGEEAQRAPDRFLQWPTSSMPPALPGLPPMSGLSPFSGYSSIWGVPPMPEMPSMLGPYSMSEQSSWPAPASASISALFGMPARLSVQDQTSPSASPPTLAKRYPAKAHPSTAVPNSKASTSSTLGVRTASTKKPNKPLHASHRLSLAKFYADCPLITAVAIAGLALTIINTTVLLLLLGVV
ncbi:hypothetical protein PRZ48_004982 [Zasmidium cellare]|uniref:Uncharacterized protein n=1 Tax=Zasmidium cellare TaxID=395010 RepID=A0ABR0ERF5_ZASCE|nr:hypothetical protein PRZ48_004982 [Zasmidium cellare]